MIGKIAEGLGKIFEFIMYERDPDKQARRLANREYKILKKATQLAVKIFYLQDDHDELPIDHVKQRRALTRKIKSYTEKFFIYLAQE
jgi:hypothetical protein